MAVIEEEKYKLHLGDCLEVMDGTPDSSVDLILTDPPYFKVKGEAWDRQWDKPAEFLAWLDRVLEQFQRILKPNGSLYLFASPQMAARVEVLIGERFNVLNSIRWVKSDGWHKKAKKEGLRSYLSPWEAVVFAEHYGADNMAKGETGYAAKCDELRGFLFEPLRAYIAGEFERAGMLNTPGKIAANVACGFSPSAGGMASRHYFSRSQWQLPTAEHYQAMRELLNSQGGDYLRKDYDKLRKDYDKLRKDYDKLRRPFGVTAAAPYTDVWDFQAVRAYAGKHPCEKPQALLEHIITSSSRPGAVVFDAFSGTGSAGIACATTGRRFLGIELNQGYFDIAAARIKKAFEEAKK